MADTETTKHTTDSLESTLAVVLKETGKYFRAARSHDARQIGMAKAAIAQVIPAANLKFHEALDEIEIEILRAKAVFDRDLSSIRMKRAERERAAAGILNAQSPKAITKGATPRDSPKEYAKSNSLPISGPGAEAVVGDDVLDISMIDQEPIQDQPPDQTSTNPADAIKTEPFALPQELSQDPEQPKGLAISLPGDPSTSVTKPDPETIDLTPGQNPKEETSTPNENSLQDTADFDSMFNDPVDTTEDLDFALAFPADDVPAITANDNPLITSNNNNDNTPDLLNASAFENISIPQPINTTATDPQQTHNNVPLNPGTNENEDISSLLPSLENYVNDPTTTTTTTHTTDKNTNTFDVSIADMVSSLPLDKQSLNVGLGVDVGAEIGGGGEGGAGGEIGGGGGVGAGEVRGVIESSFEDMFGLDSYMDGTGEDDLGGVGEFDEGLFDRF
ncbi:MAG: hypothetical protein L6R37_006485 [Teloschistes peruensis]|nr:MAG: hypothetical protein L6R37_006485 [Teloschistes peruensis]